MMPVRRNPISSRTNSEFNTVQIVMMATLTQWNQHRKSSFRECKIRVDRTKAIRVSSSVDGAALQLEQRPQTDAPLGAVASPALDPVTGCRRFLPPRAGASGLRLQRHGLSAGPPVPLRGVPHNMSMA